MIPDAKPTSGHPGSPGQAPETLERQEFCSIAVVRRVAAMLDLDPASVAAGQPLPRGWQFVLMAADTRRSALRSDGFPGLGVPMPDLGLPRLMLGGRSVAFHADIPIGSTLLRTSAVQSIRPKTTATGSMAVVTLVHELRVDGQAEPALVETQTYLLLPSRTAAVDDAAAQAETPPTADQMTVVVPDETLLFQYSALGFNSHRIHIDREHARNVEGFVDLVVNGGLATLLLTEFLRRELGVQPAALKVRHLVPLYCNRPITLTADRLGERWHLKAYDDRHRLAVDMEVNVK
jgi:3-methylfumaryl-CoA hydratase